MLQNDVHRASALAEHIVLRWRRHRSRLLRAELCGGGDVGEEPKRAGGIAVRLWVGQEHAPAAPSRIATWRPVPVQPGALDFADVIGARRQDPPPVLEVRWVHCVPRVA